MIFSENKIDFQRLNELWEIYQGIRGIVGMRKGRREKKKQIAAPEEVKNMTRNRQKRNIWL